MPKLFDGEAAATQTAAQTWAGDKPYSVSGVFDGAALVVQLSYDGGATWTDSTIAHTAPSDGLIQLEAGVQWRFDLRSPGAATDLTVEIL